jgi:signal transduction histidine kinase
VRIDRNRTLQILTNLIMNAKQAIVASGRGHGSIRVEGALVSAAGATKLRIRVQDDGAGIPAENLTRIFAGGFTTHPGGHGIGLHSAANLAAEMGGTLAAASEGPGRGATFTLLLPVSAASGGGPL